MPVPASDCHSGICSHALDVRCSLPHAKRTVCCDLAERGFPMSGPGTIREVADIMAQNKEITHARQQRRIET